MNTKHRITPLALGAAVLVFGACKDGAPMANTSEAKILTSPAASSSGKLAGKTIAFLATDGVEQVELLKPQKAFADEGAKTVVVSPKTGTIQGMNHHEKGDKITVDVALDKADPKTFDALVLPGGVVNPDALRMDANAVSFTKSFAEAGKPISAICHGPWLLAEAGLLKDRKVTSWPSLRTDLQNAGATWVDQEVVTDKGLTTSRKPDDIPAFVKKSIEEFTEPQHDKHAAR